MEKLVDRGMDMAIDWFGKKSENEEKEIELVIEFEKDELITVNTMDKRDKIYKIVIISVCLIIMTVLAYFEKASPVLPIIGVIIGFVLQSDSITKYYAGSSKKRNVFPDD